MSEERVKPIVLRDTENGMVYTLEFSRESVKFAEARGFDIQDVRKAPLTKVPELFYYAFRMHHKNVARDKTDTILFDYMGGLSVEALERLIALYMTPLTSLISDNDEDPKNGRVAMEL